MAAPPIGKYFAIIIAESGQKQLIYRSDAQRITEPGMPYFVQYETEQVLIDGEFWRLLSIADKIAAITGKSRILEPAGYLALSKCLEAYGKTFADDYMFFASRLNTAKARLCGFLALAGKE
jgi:hypothetical protein